MRHIIKNYERQELFDLYNKNTNPFSFITTKIDITNAYNYSRKHKHLYALLCYLFTKALNRIDNFKYRIENGEIVKYDTINPSYTEMLDSGDVSFITLDLCSSIEEFCNLNDKAKEDFKKRQTAVDFSTEANGQVWLSCLPWFKFIGVVPPFNKDESTPQIIWDKFEIVDGRVYINVMLMANHGFVDGSHFGKLIQYINEELASVKED